MNEGMFSQIKGLLGQLVSLHERLVEILESQMTQPLPDKPVAQAPATPKTMPKEEPVVRVDERNRFGESSQQAPQSWSAQEQNKPKAPKK